MRNHYFLLALGAVGLITSCADDENLGRLQSIAEQFPDDEQINNDLTRGVNVFISDHNGADTLYLDTKKGVSLEYDASRGLTFRQVRDEKGFTCLIPSVADGFSGAVGEVTVSASDKASKKLTVILRGYDRTRADDAFIFRGVQALSRGIPAVTQNSLAPLNALNDTLLMADGVINYNSFGREVNATEIHETSYSKTTSSYTESLGLSGAVPAGATMISASFNQSSSSSTTEESEREYYIKQRRAVMGQYEFNTGLAEDKHPEVGLLYYLDNTLNNILNNNKTYQSYPRTKDGVYRILDKYGVMLADHVELGGYVTSIYSREQNIYDHSAKWDCTIGISAKRLLGNGFDDNANLDKETQEAIKLWAEANQITPTTPEGKLNTSFGGGESDYQRVSKSKLEVTMKGGNIDVETSFDKWIPQNNPEKWVVVSWKNSETNTKSTFYRLLDFVKDFQPADASTPDNRCTYAQLIDRYIEDYMEDRKIKDDTSTAPYVVADVIFLDSSQENYKKYLTGEKDWHKGDFPKPFVMKTSSDQKERIYYPLMANNQDPNIGTRNLTPSKALETGNDSFVGARHRFSHFIYYAMDRADRCAGFTSVIFDDDQPSGAGWNRRGNSTDRGILAGTYDCFLYVQNYSYGRYEYKNINGVNCCNKVTGIGIYCNDDSKIIGATPGTDLPRPFNAEDTETFQKIWNSNKKGNVWKLTEPIYQGWIHRPHKLLMAFTYEIFDRDIFDFTKNDSNVPVNSDEMSNPSMPLTWEEH